MPRAQLQLLLALLLPLPLSLSLSLPFGHGASGSRPGGDQAVLQPPASHPPQRRLQGRFLHITDLHPDEFYKAHSATDEDSACHHGTGMAGAYGAEVTDCDSPLSLVNATLDWIEEHLKDRIDFVVWTGDTARHDSDLEHPRTEAQVRYTNRLVADRLVDVLAGSHGRLAIPVVPTFGNNDFLPHNILYPGPNKWLHSYSDIWRRFVPEEQRHSFEFGGWFYVEVVPDRLAVFSLNTMYFFDRNAAVDGCRNPSEPGFRHMDWLRVQLQRLRDRGMKAILIGHVPPARTDSKQNWDESCWQKYTLWLQQYRDVVAGALYGHMNIDHFLLQDTKEIDLEVDSDSLQTRDSWDDEMSVASKGDYLLELRKEWSDLPKSAAKALSHDDDGTDVSITKKKDKKLEKIGGKYAERYQLSLISPSVVPNYFPTIRVVEYNITGFEDTPVWVDSFNMQSAPTLEDDDEFRQELKRSVEIQPAKEAEGKKDKKKKKPTDPNLIVPDGPPKHAPPGPAYYPQPFTFVGYTQYFANLTYINNDVPDTDVDGTGWRDGNHGDADPEHKKPRPREFKYEVEYSTFDDDIFKLSDLTVKSYLKLAYRIGKHMKSEVLDVLDNDNDDEAFGEDNTVVEKGKKSKKKNKKKKKNEVWMHFLTHAFVGTVPEDELEDIS